MDEEISIAEELLMLTLKLQNFCETTNNKNFDKNVFSIKFKILFLIKEYGKISPSILVSNLNIAKSNIALFCKSLISEKLIESKHDEFDRRIIYYCLTKQGEEFVSSFVGNFSIYINSKLDEKQQKSMQKNAKLLLNNLSKIGVK